jgi:hypothetical protein
MTFGPSLLVIMSNVARATERGIMPTSMEESSMTGRAARHPNDDAWNISFEGTFTVDNSATGEHKHMCGRMDIEASDQRTWVLHLRLGLESLPMVTLAGTDSMRTGIIREAIISSVLAANATSESEQTPQ